MLKCRKRKFATFICIFINFFLTIFVCIDQLVLILYPNNQPKF